MNEIENEVKQVIAKCLKINVDDISLSTTPDDISEWDSLGHITLVLELEGRFQVEFPPEVVAELDSVAKILNFLTENAKV